MRLFIGILVGILVLFPVRSLVSVKTAILITKMSAAQIKENKAENEKLHKEINHFRRNSRINKRL